MGRPLGSQNKDKPYRDALRMEAIALSNGVLDQHPPGSLRAIAQVRLLTACTADGHPDAKEIADRLDGKVPQAIAGVDEDEQLTPLVPTINLTIGPKPASTPEAGGSVPDASD